MATQFGLAVRIPERRVRPIWDAVDSRQFNAALKLCIALLAKYPNSPYAFLSFFLISFGPEIRSWKCTLASLNCGIHSLELSSEEKLKSLTFNEDLQAWPWWLPLPDVDYLSGCFDGSSAYCWNLPFGLLLL